MRLPQLFLAIAITVLSTLAAQAAPKTPYHRAMDPYVAELDRQCRERDLRDLSAGDLELIMEGFEDRLTLAQRHKVQDAVGYRCARIEAGLTCGNTASLVAFRRLGILKRFVTEACAAGWICRGFSDCARAKP